MKQIPAIAAAIVLAGALPCLAATAPITLPNGVCVLAVEAAAGDTCGVSVALQIGPERVPAAKAGLRAVTQQVLLGRIRSLMKERTDLASLRRQGTQGAGFVVETQWDHVEFTASVTSRELPRLLEFLGPAIFEAEWTQDDFVSAKDVLAREEQGSGAEGEAGSYEAYHLFRKALVGVSPLAQPIYGTDATRESITLVDVKTFHRSYYVPNVTSVCVVSPLPSEQVAALIEGAFGKYKARKLGLTPSVSLGTDETRVETGVNSELASAVVIVGVPLPPVGTDGYLMGHLLHAALSGPLGALAEVKLPAEVRSRPSRDSDREGNVFAVMPIPIARAPYLAVAARAMATGIEDVRSAAVAQIMKFAREPLSAEALARAKTRAINLYAEPMDQPQSAATILNRRALFGDKQLSSDEFVDRIEAVTASQLQAFAIKQFTRHAVGVLLPGD